MKEPSSVRMLDVAAEAGVSVATVSAVINRTQRTIPVSDATREKVLAAIRKLNYRINDQARSLRSGRTNTIGVVASDLTQPFSGQMLRVVEHEVHQRRYHLLLSDTQNSREREKSSLDLLMQKAVDGILFLAASNELEDEGILTLKANGIPVVLTERELEGGQIPCVMVDNIEGGMLATRHLLAQGHTRIGYISGPAGNLISVQRRSGYEIALTQAGLRIHEPFIAQGGMTLECGYRAMMSMLERADRPTAVFTFNDMVAIGAIRAVLDSGLRVPDDMAIVGFDDLPMAAYAEPPLTTVRQPVQKMCKTAVKMLLDILDGRTAEGESGPVVLEPELVVRRSSGNSHP